MEIDSVIAAAIPVTTRTCVDPPAATTPSAIPSMFTSPSCPPRITSLRELFVLCVSFPTGELLRAPSTVTRTALPKAVVVVVFISKVFTSTKVFLQLIGQYVPGLLQKSRVLGSPLRVSCWLFISVSQCLQKRDELILPFIGQPEVPNRCVHILHDFWRRPANHLFSRSALLAMRKFVARVIEVNDLLQALKVAIVCVRFDEVATRSHVHIP